MPFPVRERCGHCRQVADMPFVFVDEYNRKKVETKTERQRSGSSFPQMTKVRENEQVTGYGCGLCPLCGQPTLFMFQSTREMIKTVKEVMNTETGIIGGSSGMTLISTHPPAPKTDGLESWPEVTRSLFNDAVATYDENRSPALVISACRSVLDVATKELGGTEEKLAPRIDELRKSSVITQPMADWSHALRLDGNKAIHEIDGSREEAAELIGFVRLFMQMTFTLPAEIAERKRAAK